MYELLAHYPERFWLKTSGQIFSTRGDRLPITVDLSKNVGTGPVKLLLDERGGRVKFRTMSEKSGQYVRAFLTVCRPLRKHGEAFDYCPGGSLSFNTGDSGAVADVLLPVGEYIRSGGVPECYDRPFTVVAGRVAEVVLLPESCTIKQEYEPS
ncbi:MAG TPA: hypothetical protein VGK94_07285 [Candidatus Polarisedimenticolia bacterium]|jgi:hypothetical protein